MQVKFQLSMALIRQSVLQREMEATSVVHALHVEGRTELTLGKRLLSGTCVDRKSGAGCT